MKRITAILLSVLMMLGIFSGCTGNDNNIYIGEGKMTVIRSLIITNGFFVNEVFGANHLPVDTAKTLNKDSRVLAPVMSDKISTYEALENLIHSTYTEEAAEKLLSEQQQYINIDGKLYFDLHYAESDNAEYNWSDCDIQLKKINDDGTMLFNVKVKKIGGLRSTFKMNISDTDGVIRLCDFYN